MGEDWAIWEGNKDIYNRIGNILLKYMVDAYTTSLSIHIVVELFVLLGMV